MSSVNLINSNVSFGKAKKAEGKEKQPKQQKVSKHIQKRAMDKYGVDYMSLSPEAQKVIKKDINYELFAIGITTLGAAGLSLYFAQGKKLTSGLTEAVMNSAKKVASNIPGLKNKINPDVKEAKGVMGFAADKLNLLLHAKDIKAEEKSLNNLMQGVLDRIEDVDDDVVNVNGIKRFVQKAIDNEETPDSVKNFATSLKDKIGNLDGEVAPEELSNLQEFIRTTMNKANDAFDSNSGLGKFIHKVFDDENAAAVEKSLESMGIKNGASVVDTTVAGVGSAVISKKAGKTMDDATDKNNGEVTEEALIAHIQEKGSEAVLKGFGQQALNTAREFFTDSINSL